MRRAWTGLLAVAGLLACAPAAGAAPPALSASVVGEPPQDGGVFRFPQAIAFSPGGNRVFVGDQYGSRVQAFDRDGTYRFSVGAPRAVRREPGRLGVVGGVAADRSGHLYVLDAENERVQVFSQDDGHFITAFGDASTFDLLQGNPATGAGISAGGIAVAQPSASAAPIVYVADSGNDRVERFVLDPTTLAPTGSPTLSPPSLALSFPQGVAVDGAGSRVYVADDDNHRVVVLDPATLAFVTQVGTFGTGDGQFQNPYDVAVDARSPAQLYVADNLNSRVEVFDASSLAFVATFGTAAYGPGVGHFEIVRSVGAVGDDPQGGVGVADTANNRVQVLAAAGNVTGAWGLAGRGPGYVTRPGGAAFLPGGGVAVADAFDQRIERFAADGTYDSQLGQVSGSTGFATQGADPGQFSLPGDVDVDVAGNTWVADTGNDRVQEIGPGGNVVLTTAPGALDAPASIASDGTGGAYVADTGHGTVEHIAAGGAVSAVRSGLSSPSAVAVGGGTVWAADATHVLDALGGTQVAPPPGEAAWDHPAGVEAAADGTLYVAERRPGTAAGARVVRGTPAGGGTYSWDTIASEGAGAGDVVDPGNLSLSPAGTTLLVADTGNDRVLRFDAPGVSAPAPAPLTVAIDDPGRGTVTSDLPGIACLTDCVQHIGAGRTVVLTAHPGPGSALLRWTGACAGAGSAPTCTLTTGGAQTAGASFGVAPPPAPAAPAPPPPPPPVAISRLSLSTHVLHRARPADHRRHRHGQPETRARATVQMTRAAALLIGVQQGRPGRRQGSQCRVPSRANRHGRRCTRYVALRRHRTLARTSATRVFALTPSFAGSALSPGSYRLTVVATDSSGNRVGPRTTAFRIER